MYMHLRVFRGGAQHVYRACCLVAVRTVCVFEFPAKNPTIEGSERYARVVVEGGAYGSQDGKHGHRLVALDRSWL